MKKRNILKAWIAALVVAVLILTTTAVPLSNGGASEETYVDPNIKLTRKDLSWLIKSVPFIKDGDCREFILEIIKILIIKGTVNSEQIEQIISTSDYELTGIHFGCKIYADGCCGIAIPIPGFFRSGLAYISKGGLLFWDATCDPYGNVCINVICGSTTYTNPHSGFAFVYGGVVSNKMNTGHGIDESVNVFDLDGRAVFTIIG